MNPTVATKWNIATQNAAMHSLKWLSMPRHQLPKKDQFPSWRTLFQELALVTTGRPSEPMPLAAASCSCCTCCASCKRTQNINKPSIAPASMESQHQGLDSNTAHCQQQKVALKEEGALIHATLCRCFKDSMRTTLNLSQLLQPPNLADWRVHRKAAAQAKYVLKGGTRI